MPKASAQRISESGLRRLLAVLFLLFFALAPHEADRVGREAFIHDQILWQRKTPPGEGRVFQWDERRLTLEFQMRKAEFCSMDSIVAA